MRTDHAASTGTMSRPAGELAFCSYPTAADTAAHGLFPLPAALPAMDEAGVEGCRDRRLAPVALSELDAGRVLETARVVAASFAVREPQCRHLRPAASAPAGLAGARHADGFGASGFGAWSVESLLVWFVRLLVLTDPASPRGAVETNRESLELSLAVPDGTGRPIGGAFNEIMPQPEGAGAWREGDPFLDAMMGFLGPVLEMLEAQDGEALGALSAAYPAFGRALREGRVGHHFMIARSDAMPKAGAMELFVGSAARFRALGCEYMVVEATNQWTGAACEAVGGVRVHFTPFRARRWVRASAAPVAGEVSSVDGYLAGKDSGSMFYVIRL